ncbi:OmpA/MotB family protein [Azorhizophilus paspali]|uniref:Flagellar motor protein MotB n=1 Tax=Azorhizophilus paspali TaxID=69963 RepID=A0ABV6SRW0_AZOPA
MINKRTILPGGWAGFRGALQGLPMDQLGKDIEVIVKEGTVNFRISSKILFNSAQADLSLDGLRVLQQLVPVLNSSRHDIVVVGHTDLLPIRSTCFPSNWELSRVRAGSVRYLEANGVARQRMRAVSLADTRPLLENSSPEGWAGNRWVELILETLQVKKQSKA